MKTNPYTCPPITDFIPLASSIFAYVASTRASDTKTKIFTSNSLLDEAGLLLLNNEKAKLELGWKTKLSLDDTIKFTYEWYYGYFKKKSDIIELTERQIDEFLSI